VLETVTPASLELSCRAAEECEQQRTAQDRQWRLRLERASQETARAFRQYNAVEPENRLVARTLERRWEDTLLAQRSLEEEYDRFQQEQPTRLSVAERAQIAALASDLPGLWQSPRTSVEDKRQVVRLLLSRVVVTAPVSSRELIVQLHWNGGTVTEHRVNRAVRSWKQIADATAVWELLRGWLAEGWTSERIAEELNKAGHRTPHDRAFKAESVRQLLSRGGPREAKTAEPTDRQNPPKSP
jgi:hypothetical protein